MSRRIVKLKYVAFDSGYDAVKIITDSMFKKKKDPLIFPSLAKRNNTSSMIEDEEYGSGLSISKDNLEIEVKDNEEFYQLEVGNTVFSKLQTGGFDYKPDKFKEPEELGKLLGGLSIIHNYADKITIDVLAIGLPILHYKEYKSAMKERFTGKFQARIYNDKGEKVTVDYIIDNVIVLPQCLAALIYSTSLNDKLDSNDTIGILDIGGRTTDGLLYANGSIVDDSPFSLNLGMSNIIRNISKELKTDKNRVMEAIINGNNYVFQNQKNIPIGEKVEFESKTLSTEIANGVFDEWRDFIDRVKRIMVVGGAIDQIKPYLVDEFENIEVEVMNNPQIANLYGYLIRARDLYKKKKAEETNIESVK